MKAINLEKIREEIIQLIISRDLRKEDCPNLFELKEKISNSKTKKIKI